MLFILILIFFVGIIVDKIYITTKKLLKIEKTLGGVLVYPGSQVPVPGPSCSIKQEKTLFEA
jgi:hypothetical protein